MSEVPTGGTNETAALSGLAELRAIAAAWAIPAEVSVVGPDLYRVIVGRESYEGGRAELAAILRMPHRPSRIDGR